MLSSGNRQAIWKLRAERFSQSRFGVWLLALIAFADSSIVPVMPDLLLVPMMLLRPKRIWLLSWVCVVASTFGSFVGYAIGHVLWIEAGQPLVGIYGRAQDFQIYQGLVRDWGVWIIVAKSFTPIPFKFIAIAAGVASMNFPTFAIAAFVGRALHFGILAGAVWLWGQQIVLLAEQHKRWLVALGLLIVIGVGIACIKIRI